MSSSPSTRPQSSPNGSLSGMIPGITVNQNTRSRTESPGIPGTSQKNHVTMGDGQQVLSKRIACIECRQQKVRCDAHQNYPNSCTRCTKKSISCVLQPDFKRTYKRRRLVEVEKENELLRQSILHQPPVVSSITNLLNASPNLNPVGSQGNGSSVSSANSPASVSAISPVPESVKGKQITPVLSNILPHTPGLAGNRPNEQETQRRMVSAGTLLDLSNATSTRISATTSLSPIALTSSPSTSSAPTPTSGTINGHSIGLVLNNDNNEDPNTTRSYLPLTQSTKASAPLPSIQIQPSQKQALSENGSAYSSIPTSRRLSATTSNSGYSGPLDTRPVESSKYQDLPPPVYQRKPEPSTTKNTNSNEMGPPPVPSSVTESWQDYENGIWKCSQKSMEGVTLVPSTISSLFNEFISKYHPTLPVVDITRGPERTYQLSPPLFWTIMTVASRRYDRDGKLMQKLTPLLKTCLSEITISPTTRFASGDAKPFINVASVYTVQAFLIFTMWPSISSTMTADSSWNTAGLAMYSAIKVGLHCPGYARGFGRIAVDNPCYPQISEQIRTWVCCNIVSQTVSTVYGFPGFTSFDASVMAACNGRSSVDVPESIKQLMQIEYLEDEIAKSLNSNPKDPLGLSELSERLSLIQLLSRKLDELEMKLGTVDNLRKFVLLGARVHLLTYYFLDNGQYSEIQLQKGIIQLYNSALALMDHSDTTNRKDRSFFKYLPGIYVHMLWQSTVIICKVYHSPFSKFVDAETGRVLYLSCISLVSKASIFKHDMMYRASEMMQQTWRLYASLARRNISTTKVRIRTRMSASVFFDTLWTMKEEWGIRSVAPAILNQRNSEDDEDSLKNLSNDESSSASRQSPEPENSEESIQLGKRKPSDKFETTSGDENGAKRKRKQRTPKVQAKSGADTAVSAPSYLELTPGSSSTKHTSIAPNLNPIGVNFSNSNITLSPATSLDAVNSHIKGENNLSSIVGSNHTSNSIRSLLSGNPPSSFTVHDQQNNMHTPNSTNSGLESHPESVVSTVESTTLQTGSLDDILLSFDTDLCLRDVEMLMSDFGFRDDEAFQVSSDDFDSNGVFKGSANGPVVPLEGGYNQQLAQPDKENIF